MTLSEFFKNDIFAADAGCRIAEYRQGYAKVQMTVTERHLNAGGTCQGGAIFTLADLACAVCFNSHARLTVSLSSKISFIHAPVAGDELTAEAVEKVNHPKVPFCEVVVTDQNGNTVAMLTGQGYRKKAEIEFSEIIPE